MAELNVQDTPQGQIVIWTNILYKLAGYSSVLLIADYLVPGLFSSLWPVFSTAAVLAAIGTVADIVIVPRLGNLLSIIVGSEVIVLMVYVVPRLWPPTKMTLWGAIAITVCIAPLEFALHRYVLRRLFGDE